MDIDEKDNTQDIIKYLKEIKREIKEIKDRLDWMVNNQTPPLN